MASLNYKSGDEWKKVAGGKTGVLAFNHRAGAVMPAEGDYNAEMVGARPNTWMPNIAEVGGVNPNLLHNWYFGNPVNQRDGELLVPPDVPWFTSLSFSTPGGRTDGYYVYTPYNAICGSIQIGDVTGYVSVEYLFRRYVGNCYTIDRWKLEANTQLDVFSDSIRLTGQYQISQFFEKPVTGEVTVSLLFKSHSGASLKILTNDGTTPVQRAESNETGGLLTATFNADDMTELLIGFRAPGNSTAKLIAAKMEVGSTQTLAHQDENGTWVLNEIPDYAEELAKCQRYQLVLGKDYIGESGYRYRTMGNAYVTTATNVVLKIPTPVTMVKSPTFVAGNQLRFCYVDSAGFHIIPFTPTGYTYIAVDKGIVSVDITGSGFSPGQVGWIDNGSNTSNYLILDANL